MRHPGYEPVGIASSRSRNNLSWQRLGKKQSDKTWQKLYRHKTLILTWSLEQNAFTHRKEFAILFLPSPHKETSNAITASGKRPTLPHYLPKAVSQAFNSDVMPQQSCRAITHVTLKFLLRKMSDSTASLSQHLAIIVESDILNALPKKFTQLSLTYRSNKSSLKFWFVFWKTSVAFICMR